MTLSPIYCSECGAQNVPGAKFCVSCGHVMHMPDEQESLPPVNAVGTGLLPQDSLLNKRYRIRKLVGKGGMGAVYKAEDVPYGDRPVAIKEMRQSSLAPKELEIATEQFKVEAIMLARLQHPSLPRIYDHFLEGNRWYLVMDFIDGETLDERLRRTPGRKLPPAEVVDIGIQLCRVLDYLHKRQPPVVFRDLKPSNVMLTPDGHLYLIDFGIARIFKPGQAKDTKAYGSIGYSAPEQFDREQTTDQADIYSLGITMHEMLSGSIPALTPFSLPRLNFPSQPALEQLATLIAQMIEMDKGKRTTSIEKARQELESIRDGLRQATYVSSSPVPPVAPPTQYTPQPVQEAPHLAPTQYVPPPAAATVAEPAFIANAPQSVLVAQLQQPVVRRAMLARGSTRKIVATLIGIVIFVMVTLIIGNVINDAQVSGNSFLLNAIVPAQGSNAYFVRWDYFIVGLSFFIPCFFAARYGLLVGLIVSLGGAALGDVISQFLPAWYWFAGYAVLGLVPGLAYLRTRGAYNKAANVVLALVFSLIALLLWSVILIAGDFKSLSVDFGIFPPTLLTLALVQLVTLVPLAILLIASNAFPQTRANRS